MRRAIFLIALFAVIGAGCGGGDDDEQTTDSQEAQTSIEPEKQERAESMILELSDLPPGWRAGPVEEDEEDECEAADPDLSSVTETGEAESPNFQLGQEVISSTATIYSDAEEAQRATDARLEALADPERADCLRDFFVDAAEEEEENVEIGEPQSGELSFAAPTGIQDPRAFQIVIPVEEAGSSSEAVFEFFFLHQDDAAAGLITYGIDDPLDPSLRDELLQVVADRMLPTPLNAQPGTAEGP